MLIQLSRKKDEREIPTHRHPKKYLNSNLVLESPQKKSQINLAPNQVEFHLKSLLQC